MTNAGSYRVLVSNLGGFTNSVNALLIVQPGFQTAELNTGNTNALVGMTFFNGLNGAIIGSNGVMRITRDGGATWTIVNTGMTNITDVQFVGGAIFIAGGGAHTIGVSYDGGETWSAAYPGPQRIHRLRFLSPNLGFAVGDDGAVLQWDGVVWTAIPNDIDVRLLGIDTRGGIPVAVGEAGQIWRFKGTNWVLRHPEVNLATFNDVRFCGNGSVGLAVGTGGIIHRTTDCGLTWEPYTNPAQSVGLNAITFGDCGIWWVAGDNGTLLLSTDGGATWGTIYTGTTDRITDVVFIDGVGFWVDDGGHLQRFIYAPIPYNPPPQVTLTAQVHRGTNWACVPLRASAAASDSNGFVTQVEFFVNGRSIGTDFAARFQFDWTNAVLGEFTFTAVATDNQGVTSVSAPVTVFVGRTPVHLLVLGGMTTNRLFKCCMTGEPGRDYEMYAHTNVAAPFATWEYLGLMTPTNTLLEYIDPQTTSFPYRFHRARQVP